MTSGSRRVVINALFALALILTGIALFFMVQSLEGRANIFGFRGAIALLTVSFASAGWLLASRRPENPIGWIFLLVSVASGVQAIAQEYPVYARNEPDDLLVAIGKWIDTWAWVPLTGAVGVWVFLLFPTGRPPSPRWRWVAVVGSLGIVAFTAAFFLGSDVEELGVENIFFDVDDDIVLPLFYVGGISFMLGILGSVASLIVRFRRSSGDERQQLIWFAAAAAVWAFFLVLTFLGELVLPRSEVLSRIGATGTVAGFVAIPVAIGVAVLKYRLYELDVVINRAVLYGALVAIITLLYVGIVVGIGAAIGSRGNVLLSILATAIIAVAFQPLRERVRHLANRLVYGKRATPYEVLSEFSEGLGSVYSAGDVLPRLARLVGEGTGGQTGVWLHVGDQLRLAASWLETAASRASIPIVGDDAGFSVPGWDRTLPVRHRGDLLGALTIRKPPQEPLTGTEERLVADVAAQAGLLLGNVRLIEELRASRQRLVAAQDQERRRLERNIHDGAQQQLVALAVKLRLVEAMAGKDPEKAGELAAEARGETQAALEDLRDLARGIYPPLLADQGLAAAVEAQARKSPLPVEVHPNGLGRYPQEAEAAAYFCVLEALQNAAKYAEASRVVVRLGTEDGTLRFEVTDDGRGFDPATTPRGAGLQNMTDRVEALGGNLTVRSTPGAGTVVEGRIPV